MSARKILISGAGIGGLCAAWWLNRHGYQTVLAERAASIRAGGYMVGVAGLGRHVLAQMDLLEPLRAAAIPFERSLYLDGAGRRIMNLEYGKLLRRMDHFIVLRADMVGTLHQALDGASELRLDSSIGAMRQDGDGVDVTFSDGREERFACVIGADGYRSQTRRLAFGPDADFGHDLGMQAAAYWLDERFAMEEDQLSFAEPGRLSMYYRIADRVAALHIWRGGGPAVAAGQRKAVLLDQFGGSHARVRDAIAGLAPEQDIFMDALAQVDVPVWHRHRVVLLGDAAHCLTLANGQGASMALAGAACLAQELAADNSPDAFLRYQRRMQGGINALQLRGRKAARMYVPGSAWSCLLRNCLMKALPQTMLVNFVAKSVESEIRMTDTISLQREAA